MDVGLVVVLVITCAVLSSLLTQLNEKLAEEAIRERTQEAKAVAERRREQAARPPPRPEHRLERSPPPGPPPAGANQPVDFEDVGRLRSDPEYRAKALKWAEEVEAQRAKDRRPREETPEQWEAAAALTLKIARRLEAEGFPIKAHARYREIVDKCPEAQAAKEAAQALETKKP